MTNYTIEIEHDIPAPSQRAEKPMNLDDFFKELDAPVMRKNRDWPFKRMQPGDSVKIRLEDWPKAINAIHARKHSTGQRFEHEHYIGYVRVWCVAGPQVGGVPKESRQQKAWGFSKCKVGDAIYCHADEYTLGKNAMRAAERRTGFKFDHGVKGKRAVFLRIA